MMEYYVIFIINCILDTLNCFEEQIFFTAIQNKILKQTTIPITIPYAHSINIYKQNNIILKLTLLPCAKTENFLDES